MKILIAASGKLGFETLKFLLGKIEIVGIITDKKSEEIINFALEKKIDLVAGNPRLHRNKLKCKMLFKEVDLLFSINFLYLFDEDLLSISKGLSLNIHGSLLPKYRGRAPHIWSIINGEKEVGITIHKIDIGCDTGDILIQERIEISNEITGGDVLSLYEKKYPHLVLKAIDKYQQGQLQFVKQNNNDATYFPKRSPEDGQIDWSWDGERIINWVRALTRPYPGAFSFYEEKKIFIWKVKFFKEDINRATGNIQKSGDQLKVSCKDGTIIITEFNF